MKTRTLVRKHGWVAVDVDAMEITWDITFSFMRDDKNDKKHYTEIKKWCDRTAGPGNYVCTLQNGGPGHNVKKFIFKEPKHATLFRLRWSKS